MEGHNSWSGQSFHISGSSYTNTACRFLFRFGGGWPLHSAQSLIFCSRGVRPLHNVQFLIFCNLLDIPVARFTNSSPKAFRSNPSDVQCSCRLLPESFIAILHSGPFHSLFSFVCVFLVPLVTLSPVWFFMAVCTLCCATPAQRVIFLPAAMYFFQNPHFPQVHSSSLCRRFAARFQLLCHFLSPPTSFTEACSLGTSQCPVPDCISSGFVSILSRHASVVSHSAFISFRQALMSSMISSILANMHSISCSIFVVWCSGSVQLLFQEMLSGEDSVLLPHLKISWLLYWQPDMHHEKMSGHISVHRPRSFSKSSRLIVSLRAGNISPILCSKILGCYQRRVLTASHMSNPFQFWRQNGKCGGLLVTIITGSRSDEWSYWVLTRCNYNYFVHSRDHRNYYARNNVFNDC
jgi:hypothetical protein